MKKEDVAAQNETGAAVEATETQITTTESQLPAAPPKRKPNYIVAMLEASTREFLEANEGMDLDYVRAGDWMKLTKKGNYIDKDTEHSYGDSIDVVVGNGEQRFMLWGNEKSPEDGKLIVAEKNLDDAKVALANFLAAVPEAVDRYDESDISLRYLAMLVPVSELSPEDFPPIYMFDFPPGDTIGWGKFCKAVFTGKYKTLGIPARTPINQVVVRFTSEERKGDGNVEYIGTKFEVVGLFNPKDYGIDFDPNAAAATE